MTRLYYEDTASLGYEEASLGGYDIRLIDDQSNYSQKANNPIHISLWNNTGTVGRLRIIDIL